MKDNSVTDFLSTTSIMSRRTAKEYAIRLNSFRKFVLVHYGEQITIDNLVVKVKEGLESPSGFFRVFYRTFRFHILDKERIRKSRDIQKDRTIFDFSKCAST
ncbi:MAG: hypothetical protein WBL67_13755 [Nitrososphaeraceae archaeon]